MSGRKTACNSRRRLRLTTACALALPLLGHAACKVQALELPVKMVGSRAVATVGINGTTVPLAVDSGAFFSFLTEAAAAQLKLPLKRNFGLRVEGLTGMVDAATTRVDKLTLLEGELSRVEFVVGGNEPGAGTMGVLGRNILSAADTEYDLAHGVIRFVFPNDDCGSADMAYWARATPVTEVDLVTGWRDGKLPAIRAKVKLNGTELVALFDTGATSTVVSSRSARRAGVTDAAMTPAGSMYGAGRGSRQMWTAPFETFEIGGETIERNRFPVADFDLDGAGMLLGIDFFLSHRIYVSKQQSKLFFTYNGGPVFALNKGEAAHAVDIDADAPDGTQAGTADRLARRGAASAARRDFEHALADLDRACLLEPTSARFFAQRGTIRQAMNRSAPALEDFDTALALDPSQSEARAARAVLRLQALDHEGARADLDVLDKTLAPQAQLRLGMSRLYLTLERPAQALDQLNQWLPAHPQEVGREAALNSRCWVRLRLGIDLDGALDDCNDAVDSDPQKPAYRDTRGWVHLRLSRPQKALADFDRSVRSRPENAWALFGRGLARMRLGDTAQGEADLAAARRLQPDIDLRVTRAGVMPEPAPTQ